MDDGSAGPNVIENFGGSLCLAVCLLVEEGERDYNVNFIKNNYEVMNIAVHGTYPIKAWSDMEDTCIAFIGTNDFWSYQFSWRFVQKFDI